MYLYFMTSHINSIFKMFWKIFKCYSAMLPLQSLDYWIHSDSPIVQTGRIGLPVLHVVQNYSTSDLYLTLATHVGDDINNGVLNGVTPYGTASRVSKTAQNSMRSWSEESYSLTHVRNRYCANYGHPQNKTWLYNVQYTVWLIRKVITRRQGLMCRSIVCGRHWVHLYWSCSSCFGDDWMICRWEGYWKQTLLSKEPPQLLQIKDKRMESP